MQRGKRVVYVRHSTRCRGLVLRHSSMKKGKRGRACKHSGLDNSKSLHGVRSASDRGLGTRWSYLVLTHCNSTTRDFNLGRPASRVKPKVTFICLVHPQSCCYSGEFEELVALFHPLYITIHCQSETSLEQRRCTGPCAF